MDTFHIDPTSGLALQAVTEVREFAPDAFIAVRGEVFDGVEEVYGVFELHPDEHPSKYVWKYVLARDWLADYDKLA